MKTTCLLQIVCVGFPLLASQVAQAEPWLQLYYMPSHSMAPTIVPNDKLLVNTTIYERQAPQRGEIAIFKAPASALAGTSSQGELVEFVKRVVAVPGDKVEIVNRRLRINGKWLADPGAKWNGSYRYDCKVVKGKVYMRELGGSGPSLWMVNSIIVPYNEQQRISKAPAGALPANQFFLLGDNRTNSNDSHIFGLVPRKLFRGRVLSIIFPLNHRRSF